VKHTPFVPYGACGVFCLGMPNMQLTFQRGLMVEKELKEAHKLTADRHKRTISDESCMQKDAIFGREMRENKHTH
jgi:hypothetical protein